ncbi:MAG: hypothetical protein C0418_02020 [Coriobacteriaceae bacterium]|nr:hypothetical protein [Coriobacteriaceae bacterium]
MRRALSVLLVLCMGSSLLLTGCSALKGLGGKSNDPYTLDYELDESNVDFFLYNDDFDTIVSASPFYPGSRPQPSQNTAAFYEARAKRVQGITADAAELVKACAAAKPAMATLRSDYTVYLDKVRKEEPRIDDWVKETMTQVALLPTQQLVAEQEYAAMLEQPADLAYVKAMRDYLAVTKAVQLGGLYLKDANNVAAFAAVTLSDLSESKNANVQAANAELDGKMEADVAAALKALEPVAASVADIEYGLRQLVSGDYYMAQEGFGFMASEMPKLDEAVASLSVREGLSEQDVADIKTWYAAFKEYETSLQSHFESVDTAGIIRVPSDDADGLFDLGLERAYAAEAGGYVPGDSMDAGIAAMSQEPPAPPAKGWLASGWGLVKSGFGKAKTAVGVTVDTLGSGVQVISAVGCGIYYGNKPKDIIDNAMNGPKMVFDNYNNGVSGSDTIKTAGEYIEGVEKGAGDVVGWAGAKPIELIIGKGKVSETTKWALGGLTQITTGMFTGMAKGIYKVADKRSSTADVAGGFVDIALGSIGGSKLIVKASQIPGLIKGSLQAVKSGGKAALSLAGSAANKAEAKVLTQRIAELLTKKKLNPAQYKELISNQLRVEINKAVGQLIAGSREAMIKKIRDLMSKGAAGGMTNFREGAKSSLQDLLTKSFDKSLKGLLDAGTTVMGTTLTDYLDNLVAAGLADGVLTGLINEALAVPPDPEQMAGTWSGSLTILKVEIPASEKKTADDAKCEQLFKQLEGKKIPMTLDIRMGSGGSGSVALKGGQGSGSGTIRYSGGAVTMVIGADGTTYRMTGSAAFTKGGGMKMGGSWSAPYQKSQIKMSGSWTAAK